MEAPHLIAEVSTKRQDSRRKCPFPRLGPMISGGKHLNRPSPFAPHTSRNERFIHQHRATVLSDRCKNRSPVEAMSLIGTLHAGDESLLAEDVL